jgi:hypothetical protein
MENEVAAFVEAVEYWKSVGGDLDVHFWTAIERLKSVCDRDPSVLDELPPAALVAMATL